MSKINRPDLDLQDYIFATQSGTNDRFVFGSEGTESDDLTDNLTAAFKEGWGVVTENGFPTLQDFNALGFTTTALSAYLMQMGVAEWSDKQFYPENARAMASNGVIWRCLQDHTGQTQGENAYWTNDIGSFVELTGNQTIAGIKTFSSSPIVPTPTTDFQTATKKYVDDEAGIDIATAAEIRTGTDDTKAVSPMGYNSVALGWSQTWQDVKSSRSAGVTYTNTTGRPITVVIDYFSENQTVTRITVDGVSFGDVGTTSDIVQTSITAIVPSGSEYSVNYLQFDYQWTELR